MAALCWAQHDPTSTDRLRAVRRHAVELAGGPARRRSSSPAVTLAASRNAAYVSASGLVQRLRLVHRLAPGLVALDLVLRLRPRRVHRAAGRLRPGGDLLLDLAVHRPAMTAPGHLVALPHVRRRPRRSVRQTIGHEDRRPREQPPPQRTPLAPDLLQALRPLRLEEIPEH